jgi:hypothetical protein
MNRAAWICLVAMAWIIASPAAAQSRLFSDDAPLQLVLTAPFPALVRTAATAPTPYPATLALKDGASAPQTFAVQLQARGYSRRTAGFCRFPPLWLRFDKKSVHESVFRGQHKLKLVTYCRTDPDYEQRIVLEYLAYRLYNLVTPISFKVRAAEVTYRDGDSDPGLTRFGYLIEDANDVADRNGRDELTAASHAVSARQLDPHAAARAALFEFMIANQDWEFLAATPGSDCCHNTRLIAARDAKPATASAVAPLPYDFDWSGLVDAPYAGPPPGLPIDKNTDRYYRGYCVSTGELPSVIDEYRARRADMMTLINSEPHLNPQFRAKAARFIDGFFTLLDDPGRVQRELIKHCR